nr:zf-HC2 domain-containing protein [Chloroflexota bacterium]
MTMNRHESFEELISASLNGDLTDLERQRLDTHLDSCEQCSATLAAFADQRRIIAGVRHVAPPRDLGARVRTGIERGRFA